MLKLINENIKIALSSIRTQLLRTILTISIIALGIWVLVGILTIVSALENTLSSNFASMGANTFNINRYDFSSRSRGGNDVEKINPTITYPEAKAFKDNFNYPLVNTSLSFTATSKAEVKHDNLKTDPEVTVLGVDDFFIPNSGLEVTNGRNFNVFDIKNNAFVCVVGSDFASKGILKDVNPIDKFVMVRGAKFKVIGVLKEKGSTFGDSQDLRLLIPIQIARSLYSQPNVNYTISSMVTKKEFLEDAIDNATLTMRKVRKLNPIEENNFAISRSDDLINRISEMTSVLNASAWVIGAITIFGSSIALMNIMLLSVTERTREIGVRKSLGAKRKIIAFQFFVETLIISQIGGLIGIILGIIIGYFISLQLEFEFVIPWIAIIAALITTLIVAIVSGLYPAIKASRLDPIEALRYE